MRRRTQRGAALMVMMMIVVLGGAYFFVDRLSTLQRSQAAERAHNARVLGQAKQALIGWMAQRAATAGEDNPGRLPCPEPAVYIRPDLGANDPQGIAAPGLQPDGSGGWINSTCSSIGRLPWRTLGVDKLVDAASEPLWYVVGPTAAPVWRLTSGSESLLLNSNTAGNISVDGQVAIALIVAPGAAFSTAAGTGCAAVNQAHLTTGRQPPATTINWQNYVECLVDAAGTITLTTSGGSTTRNDQVVAITAADVMPALEAAIAKRTEREIVPLLSSVYAAPSWGLTGSDVIYPYPASFANPDTSSFTGSTATGTGGGQLPLVHAQTFTDATTTAATACSSGTRCNASLMQWDNWASTQPAIAYSGVGVGLLSACSYWGSGTTAADYAMCSGTYTGTPTEISVTGHQTHGATALRKYKSSLPTGFVVLLNLTTFSFSVTTPQPTLVMGSDGRLEVKITVSAPGAAGLAGVMYWIYVPPLVTDDHELLDARTGSTQGATTGWFVRNEWHKLFHYAVAPGFTAAGAAPRSCSDSGVVTCLQVSRTDNPTKHRAILTLAGRPLAGLGQTARPSSALSQYLDSTENQNGDNVFEQQKVGRWFNDRVVSIARNP